MHHPPHAARYPLAALALALALPLACGDDDAAPASPAAGGATTTTTASGAGGSGATGGGGMTGCQTHADCTDADAAQCDGGSCVACSDNAHCEGVANAAICDAGVCVQCNLGDETACMGAQTCDLLAKSCVDVAPTSVGNCQACTNDTQCLADHRCIPMEFESQPHGHYCLKEAVPNCNVPGRPFGVLLTNKPSISGAAPATYCGIDEDLATCEAINALLQGWVCETGMTDGMCGPSGMAEVAVPGALCRQVGGFTNQCTYACGTTSECPGSGPPSSCGTGTQTPPGWCGG